MSCDEGYESSVHDSMSICESRVSLAFFSAVNLNYLQLRIRNEFYQLTQVVVDKQRTEDLLTLMRYVYIAYARRLNEHEAEQLRELNDRVVRTALPQIATGVEQHLNYIRDASTMAMPMDRAQSTTIKGETPVGLSLF